MRVKIITGLILMVYLTGIAMATEPFDPGNAKKWWDGSGEKFQTKFIKTMGMLFFIVGAIVLICIWLNVGSYSTQKSGSFADPEKKSGSGGNMIGIALIVVGAVLAMYAILPEFGF